MSPASKERTRSNLGDLDRLFATKLSGRERAKARYMCSRMPVLRKACPRSAQSPEEFYDSIFKHQCEKACSFHGAERAASAAGRMVASIILNASIVASKGIYPSNSVYKRHPKAAGGVRFRAGLGTRNS